MRKLIPVIFTLLSIYSFGQNSLVFYDSIYNVAVAKVQLYNVDNEFIGMSNEIGVVEFRPSDIPMEAKSYGYLQRSINEIADTVYLSLKYQELEEVVLKPVNKMDLYDRIIENSSSFVDKTNGTVSGIYFESVMVVNTNDMDTIYLDNLSNVAIKKDWMKKKYAYSFYCQNGSKLYRNKSSSELQDFDTTTLNKCLKFVQSFKKNLAYDLVSPKKFKLKFEENQITRNLETELSLLKFENNEKNKVTAVAGYKNLKLISWNHDETREKEYDGSGIFVNLKRYSRSMNFSENEPYFFNSILVNAIIEIGLDGKLYEIHVVKGFIKDDSVSVNLVTPFDNVEDYFETLKYSNEGVSFYKFE